MEQALEGRRAEEARAHISEGLGVESPTEMPNRVRRATGRFLLERGVLAMAAGDWPAASRDLSEAERIVDGDEIQRWNFFTANAKAPKDESWNGFRRGWVQGLNIPWGPKAYERLMVSPLASLAYLAAADRKGACVEARRFASTDRFFATFAEDVAPVRAFGHLASAIACDAASESELACAHLESAARVPRYDVLVSRVGLDARLLECRGAAAAPRPNLWLLVAFGRAPRAHGNVETQMVHIVGGAAGEPAFALIDDEAFSLPETLDLVATARADYAAAVGLSTRNGCPTQTRPGAWSRESWRTLPGHVFLLGVRARVGERVVTLRVGSRALTRRVRVDDSPRLVTMIDPTYGAEEVTPPELISGSGCAGPVSR